MSSSAGTREEMLEALKKAKQAMARRVSSSAVVEAPAADGCASSSPSAVAVSQKLRLHTPSEAKDNRSHFFDVWCRKIEMFIADPTKTSLELPRELAANDRRELHALAEKYNLSHHSRGVGAERQLILKKDALHYRMPDAHPEGIDALREQSGDAKQSKYHLRRTRADPDAAIGSIGAFGDETTAQMVRRLDRATDEYRKAVEIGYTQEELLAIEAGESVDAMLRRPVEVNAGEGGRAHTDSDNDAVVSQAQQRLPYTSHAQQEVGVRGNVERTGVGSRVTSYDEECLRCGARARIDYDVHKWECKSYCAVCARQTVWKLVEVTTAMENHLASVEGDGKRGRSSAEPSAPEEIDKNNDEDDTITVEDVVDMASMNDFSAADVNWVRRFATHHQPPGSEQALNDYIVFCIDFSDLRGMRIFRRALVEDTDGVKGTNKSRKRARHEESKEEKSKSEQEGEKEGKEGEYFLRLREVREAGMPLSKLLDALTAVIPSGFDSLAVAFPNMSVYGTAATCICQVRTALPESALTELQKEYGTRHVQYGRNLEDVLQTEEGLS